MCYRSSISVLLFCLASPSIVYSADDALNNLFEAQFLNLTEDIKVGAAGLKVDPDDIEIVEVSLVTRIIKYMYYTFKLSQNQQSFLNKLFAFYL